MILNFTRVLCLSLLMTSSTAVAAERHGGMACLGAHWLSLEIIAGELADQAPAEWVAIDQTGCVLSLYGSHDRRAGLHRGQLSQKELNRLRSWIGASQLLEFNADAERERLRDADQVKAEKTGMRELFVVSDGNTYRLQLRQDGRENTITWTSPIQEARWRKSASALNTLVSLIESMHQIGQRTVDAEQQP